MAKLSKKPQPKPVKSRRPISKWWRIVFIFLPAVVLLLGAEIVLRLAGMHQPSSFFLKHDGYVDSNERFAFRFMAPELARDPLPCHFAAAKPANTVRLFVLGESAAQGVPAPAFGFSRILDVMLRERHPDKQFEVINTGVTAINSHAVREIALDALHYQPDALVLYCGNNEVVGPYGPGTIFQSGMPGLGFIRFQLWLSRTAVWQGVSQLIKHFSPAPTIPRQWNGMEMFVEHRVGPDDPRLDQVVSHFDANILDILNAAQRRHVPVIICTVPVNLEAFPPFSSQHRSGLSDADLAQWTGFYSAGTNSEAHRDFVGAEKSYASAQNVDPLHAEVDFRRARCLQAIGRTEEAVEEFSAARDHDALRFRTDSRLNARIRELAQKAGAGVTLYDAVPDFARGQSNLFYEHVHMTFDGNYRLAGGFLPYIETATRLAAGTNTAVPAEDACAHKLAYTDWSRWRTTKHALAMLLRPPFTMQLDHDLTFPERVRAMDTAGDAVGSPQALDRNITAFDDAMKDRPDDYLMRQEFLDLLDQRDDRIREVDEAQALVNTPPPRSQSKMRYGDALYHTGRTQEAIAVYRAVIHERPEQADPRQALGDALVQAGDNEGALAAYQEAGARGCDTPEYHNNMAMLLMNKGDLNGAREHLERALQWTQNPVWQANLGGLYFKQGNFKAALAQFQKALPGMSDNPALYDNIGMTYKALGDYIRAEAAFREALRIDPNYQNAQTHLQQSQSGH